ncbi:MAG: hypothetical protein H7841_12725 [Magnetospirillum sp. WYHS-4]
MRTAIRLAAALMAVGLGGCGTTGTGFLADQIVHPTNDLMAQRCNTAGFKIVDGRMDLGTEIEKAAKNRQLTVLVDKFLDCILVDVPDDHAAANELKLLRGHVALALTATYGAFNGSGALADFGEVDFRATSKAKEQSALMLSHIERAEDYLRRASKVPGLAQFQTPPSQADSLSDEMQRVKKDYRVLSVLRVAVDAERPTIERARGIVIDVIAAAASPTAGALQGIVQDGFNAMLKNAVMDTLGRDFLADAQDALQKIKEKKTVDATDWAWGDKLLKRACARLAETGDVTPHCVP